MFPVINLKRLTAYMNCISEEAFGLLAGTLQTCCVMLLCAFAVLVHIGPIRPHTFSLYRLALELTLSPVGILLVGGLCAVVAEDLLRR